MRGLADQGHEFWARPANTHRSIHAPKVMSRNCSFVEGMVQAPFSPAHATTPMATLAATMARVRVLTGVRGVT